MKSRSKIVVGTVLALTLAFATSARADAQQVLENAVVHFGQPQPQTPAPAPVGNAVTHFLAPDDVTIQKGGTVTFVVNGVGHGIAIHRVDEDTTRDDVAADLCQGPPGTAEDDRAARATVCNGAATANLNYDITDGEGDLVIRTGTNVANSNPRVDDTEHSERLLATSGRVRVCAPGQNAPTCDNTVPGQDPRGAFLVGTTGPVVPVTVPPTQPNAPGNRIEVKFLKTGRFLVICMNRGHSLNDHMFGFVSVVDEDDEDEDDDDQDDDEDDDNEGKN